MKKLYITELTQSEQNHVLSEAFYAHKKLFGSFQYNFGDIPVKIPTHKDITKWNNYNHKWFQNYMNDKRFN